MKRRPKCIRWTRWLWTAFFGLAVAGLVSAPAPSARAFEKPLQPRQEPGPKHSPRSQREGFAAYKNRIAQEFVQYRQIVSREYGLYRQKIRRTWKQARISSRKRWVEYSADYRSRRTVDFEKGYIELELIVSRDEPQDSLDAAIAGNLADLVREDQKTAYQRNELARHVAAALKQGESDVVSDTVEERPILTRVLTGTATPDKKQVERAVTELRRQAAVTKRPAKQKNQQVLTLRTPLPPDTIRKRAAEYKGDVHECADQRGLNPALVFAVIHTESAFNPMARSNIPAYGLMQIVPQMAGRDAAALLFGKPRTLSPAYLYNGHQNIRVGTCYLYILFNRYLKSIQSPESRRYCAIAAYNTGAGNVAKAFVGSKNIGKAIRVINTKAPKAVYQHLIQNLPYAETRGYLQKVTRRMELYTTM